MATENTNIPVVKGKGIRRRKLLVVGKSLGDLTARGVFLESFGYQVVACSSHAQAVRSMQSEAFDFVLLIQGSRFQLVALDWGQGPAKVSVTRARGGKGSVSHASTGVAQQDRLLRLGPAPGSY
jgi:hypothetical protein